MSEISYVSLAIHSIVCHRAGVQNTVDSRQSYGQVVSVAGVLVPLGVVLVVKKRLSFGCGVVQKRSQSALMQSV